MTVRPGGPADISISHCAAGTVRGAFLVLQHEIKAFMMTLQRPRVCPQSLSLPPRTSLAHGDFRQKPSCLNQ